MSTEAGLRLSEDLSLPVEAVTETFCVVAQRGAGKTHTAAVLAEGLIDAGQPTCVIDPVGVWWGLRSSADGAGPGLPVTILGGDHGDLELPDEAGEAVADLVVDERLPLVLDLSLMRKGKQRRFVTDFMERLYQRNREPLHVIVDEADLFAPQRGGAETARMLGAYEDLVRRGRARGVGSTSITQRPASLHKDILTQASVLVAMRMTGARDVAAVDEWVRLHADEGQAKELRGSLPSLPVGTAWVWSPGWLELLRKVEVRRRSTFDSSATPKPGQRVQQPTRFARVETADLERLQKHLAADNPAGQPTHAGSGDVARLRRELHQVRAELEAARSRPTERVEVPALSADDWAALSGAVAALREVAATLAAKLPVGDRPAGDAASPVHCDQTVVQRHRSSLDRAPIGEQNTPTLKAGARRMLDVLVRQYPMRISRSQLGTLAKLRHTGGTFSSYLSALRTNGLIVEDGSGLLAPTDAGFAEAGIAATDPVTTEELREQWRSVLKLGARKMLDVLLDRYPDSVARSELADAVGLEPTGGTFSSYLSSLRSNGLAVVNSSAVRADDIFFQEAREA